MNLFESPWFFQMVESQGKTPADKLVGIFRIIRAWMSAPGIREQLLLERPGEHPTLQIQTKLRYLLLDLAKSAKARNPETLANQLAILLQGAVAEELRDPGSGALESAIQAAQAVVSSACPSAGKKSFPLKLTGALAAGLLVGYISFSDDFKGDIPTSHHPSSMLAIAVSLTNPASPPEISPDTIAAALALNHRFQQGICPTPQLLALTKNQAEAYTRVINFQFSGATKTDWKNIRAFMDWYARTLMTECYIPPSNGHTMVTWAPSQPL